MKNTINACFSHSSCKKKTRGQTLIKEIQLTKFKYRRPIILNTHNQCIDSDEETLTEFINFLGMVARNQQLAPSNYTNC